MTTSYNPKCNQSSGATFGGIQMPTVAEVAEREMRNRAEMKANEAAYQRALKAQKEVSAVEPKRWLSNEDLS